MSLNLMTAVTLTTGQTASKALLLVDKKLEINFDLSCSSGPSVVTYYLEYSEDLVVWFREVAEEDAGKGVVLMPKVVRTFSDNNTSNIADNAKFDVSCQFTRPHRFVRVQMSATSGTVVVNSITAPYGLGPYGTVVTAAVPPPPPPRAQLVWDYS